MGEKNKKTRSWSYLNGQLISYEERESDTHKDWKIDSTCHNENLGIGSINPLYIETNEIQDMHDEYKKIMRFLNKFVEYYASKHGVQAKDLRIYFLNYGKTELVFILTDSNNNRVTLLVKQPAVPFGKVKQEAEYLNELKEKDENVIAPTDYYALGDQELYVTPYIYQARCVASDYAWGMYIPEPYYRFEPFSKEQKQIVNICMIAKLISYYDFEKNEGIGACKLGGGDFMLPKGWELEKPTIENTLNSLLFIAAREKVKCSFADYLEIIRAEFSVRTISTNQNTLLVNIRGRVAMSTEEIESGIELGKKLIDNKNKQFLQRINVRNKIVK